MAAPGFHPAISGYFIKNHAFQYLPILSLLFPLRLPGDLQTWGAQGFVHGNLAGNSM